jgi:hypothetical protein
VKVTSRQLLACLLVLSFAGCTTAGPRAIRQGRFDYNQAIINTRSEQMLANLVRLRYRDPPFFLDISSVSTQYVLGGEGDVAVAGIAEDSAAALGAKLTYEERPTVTYLPLQGLDFADRVLRPIPMQSIILLTASGWKIDRLMRCCVQRVNDVYNAPRASGPTPAREPEFREFLEVAQILQRLDSERATAVRFRRLSATAGKGPTGDQVPADEVELRLHFLHNQKTDHDVDRLKELLDLDPDLDEFRLTTNPTFREPNEIAIFPRSLMATMSYLSQAVEPPQRDVDSGRVTVTLRPDGSVFEWSNMTGGLFRVRSSADEPTNAFIRVRYRDAWFYIDDSDLSSKSTFTLLDTLFQLQAGGAQGGVPLLTLPVGGQ